MIEFTPTSSPDKDSISFLEEGIWQFDREAGLPGEPPRPLAVFAREDGHLIGGVNGVTKWNHFIIRSVFVAPGHDRHGLGSELLREAIREACARQCVTARVVTNEREAPDFYVKNGFELLATLEDHPIGSKTFMYMKRIDKQPPQMERKPEFMKPEAA